MRGMTGVDVQVLGWGADAPLSLVQLVFSCWMGGVVDLIVL